MAIIEKIPLTINGLPDTLHRGDVISITGTAEPDSTITSQIIGPEGNIIQAEPISVNFDGKWSFETIIPQDTPFGRYEAIVTDGTGTTEVSWDVESSKIIDIIPATLKFEPGDLMTFNGTALPNEPVEFVLKNPQGVEIFSDIIQVDDSGKVGFTYQTEQSTQEGTYILLAKQKDSTEIIVAGLGELPKEQIVATLDKTNYKKTDIAKINIDGPPSATLTLLIIDPSDKEKFIDSEVILQPDGKLQYELDLNDYASGVYTMVISRANSKTTEVFSVGLQLGSGQIEIRTTKNTYEINDPILILGETNPNVLVTVQMIDPDGIVVREKETFTSNEGRISESTFRIPSDAKAGIWQIKASSGPNFATVDLEIVATVQEGMIVIVDGIKKIPGYSDVVYYHILGAQNTVQIWILDDAGNEITPQPLTSRASQDGEINQPWPIPRDLPPGTYTVLASDAFNSANATFVLD